MTSEIQVELNEVELNSELGKKQYTAIVQMDLIADSVEEAYRWFMDKLMSMADVEPGPTCLKAVLDVRNQKKIVASRVNGEMTFMEKTKR